MIDFTDRIPRKTGRRRIVHSNGQSEEVIVLMADDPSEKGTPLNRKAFMGMQGFDNTEIRFEADGTITETGSTGTTRTEFLPDGSIETTFRNKSNISITKTTKFNPDGSISEVIS